MENDSYDCNICGRAFATPNDLRSHQLSKSHHRKDVNCVFCKELFRTPGHLFMHLEHPKGGCQQFILPSILKSVEAWEADTGRLHFFTPEPVLSAVLDRNRIREMALRAFNGRDYDCPPCNRAFRKPHDLEQHFSSKHEPVHEDLYICKICNKKFKALGSLFQHLESDSCPWMSFDAVKKEAYSLLLHICAAKLRQQVP